MKKTVCSKNTIDKQHTVDVGLFKVQLDMSDHSIYSFEFEPGQNENQLNIKVQFENTIVTTIPI